MEAALDRIRRDSDARIGAAWLTAMLGRVKTIPPLKQLTGDGVADRTPEEASLDQQAQMLVMREVFKQQGLVRSWAEWRAG